MFDGPVLYALLLCVFFLILAKKGRKPPLKYPPGPKGYPILGNVLDLPTGVPIWEAFTSLANRYRTDVLYLRLMGQDIVVLNSNEAISDLIDKRSGIYSDRPVSTMVELTGVTEWGIAMMPYGERWRVRRKLCHEVLNGRLAGNFDSHRYKYTCRLLSRLLEEPERFMDEVAFMPGAAIMSVTYGIDVTSTEDPLYNAMTDANHALVTAMIPGQFLADPIPILRHIPDWFPGARFKALAKEARDKYKISIEGPMKHVKDAMKSGERFSQSITSDSLSRLEDHDRTNFDEEVIRDTSGSMFGAAAETTKSLLHSFFLAMVLNPEVMLKAQEELDRVIGKNHLPDYSDKDNLPYINAVVKELMRWNPPVPTSIPNKVIQDDVYQGYFIPAGATVIQNIWAVFRDPNVYPNPEAFNPDRFLKDGKINPLIFNPEDRVFGTGRRICPGKTFALRTLYLVIASVLSVFNIEPALDKNGNPQVPEAEYENIHIRSPKPFKCRIKPRSEEAIRLIEETWDRINY